jgi:ferredoxin
VPRRLLRLLPHALVSGQVDWLTEPLAFIQPGEILPCCCRAKGDIEIEM